MRASVESGISKGYSFAALAASWAGLGRQGVSFSSVGGVATVKVKRERRMAVVRAGNFIFRLVVASGGLGVILKSVESEGEREEKRFIHTHTGLSLSVLSLP